MASTKLPDSPIPGARTVELGAGSEPLLQRFFDANPEYFLSIQGEPAGPDEAHDEIHGELPAGWPFTRKWVVGYASEDGSLLAMANVVSDLLADGVWHIGTFIVATAPFARGKEQDIRRVAWDLVVLDEAHRLRNVYKPGNVIGRTLLAALDHVQSKVLLTATPLQNSLLELYGLVSFIDDRVFGDLDSFRSQFGQLGKSQTFDALRARLSPLCKRTLRRDVQPFVPYTQRTTLPPMSAPTG